MVYDEYVWFHLVRMIYELTLQQCVPCPHKSQVGSSQGRPYRIHKYTIVSPCLPKALVRAWVISPDRVPFPLVSRLLGLALACMSGKSRCSASSSYARRRLSHSIDTQVLITCTEIQPKWYVSHGNLTTLVTLSHAHGSYKQEVICHYLGSL